MSILFLAGALFVNGLAAILFASFVITKTGACNYKETMNWKFAAFFLGSFVILCSIEAAGYSVFKQQTDFPEKPSAASEQITPAPMPLNSIPVPQNEIPQLSSTKVIGYAERRQEMNAEVERQRKERDKHYALSDELKQKSYITPDDHSIADTPERGSMTSVKRDKNEYDQQSQIAEAGQKEQRERISEKKTRETVYDERPYREPYNPKKLCSTILRQIDVNTRNQAIFNNPIGQPTGIPWSRGILFITPEERNGTCVEYDLQIGEGKNAVSCRRNKACMNILSDF